MHSLQLWNGVILEPWWKKWTRRRWKFSTKHTIKHINNVTFILEHSTAFTRQELLNKSVWHNKLHSNKIVCKKRLIILKIIYSIHLNIITSERNRISNGIRLYKHVYTSCRTHILPNLQWITFMSLLLLVSGFKTIY